MSYVTPEKILQTPTGRSALQFMNTTSGAAAKASKFFKETLMVGDRLRFSRNDLSDGGPHQYAQVTELVKRDGKLLDYVYLSDKEVCTTVTGDDWTVVTITILSQRAFNSEHHNQLTCELPFPMKIKSIELCAYSLQNVSTASEAMRPGVEDATGNQDCHDYYSVHIDPYSSSSTVSNHPGLNGKFAIISSYENSNSSNYHKFEGNLTASLKLGSIFVGNVYNSNVGVVHDMDLGYNVKTIRLSVKDRRGKPLKCHRAHFWLKVMATTK
jgi:hypothetical protein